MIAVQDKLPSLKQLRTLWNDGIKPNEIEPIWDEINTQRVALLFSTHDLASKSVTYTVDSDGFIASMTETSSDATLVTTFADNSIVAVLTPTEGDYVYTRTTTFGNGTATESYSAQPKAGA